MEERGLEMGGERDIQYGYGYKEMVLRERLSREKWGNRKCGSKIIISLCMWDVLRRRAGILSFYKAVIDINSHGSYI